MPQPAQDQALPKMSGAFWINKPVDLTSSDVVVRLKKALTEFGYHNRYPQGPRGEKKNLKIGHGGTLDPFATGVLVILVGEATKLADCYLHSTKSYSGVIRLGARTDTGDLTGSVIKEKPIPELSEIQWQALADEFTRDLYLQTPPMYSAKKQAGVALHSLARQGLEIERKSILKKISFFRVRLISKNELQFEVGCESGTYVRVLAEDLAIKAGTLGHLTVLARTQSSDATLADAPTLDEMLENLASKVPLPQLHNYKPISQVASHLPSIEINDSTRDELKNGLARASQILCVEAHLHYPNARYVLIRDRHANTTPVALLENQPEHRQFRLQRVFNE